MGQDIDKFDRPSWGWAVRLDIVGERGVDGFEGIARSWSEIKKLSGLSLVEGSRIDLWWGGGGIIRGVEYIP